MTVPFITLENDIFAKLETDKALLVLYQSPFGHRQFSGFITEISDSQQAIYMRNGNLAKKIPIENILLVIEWK